MSVRIVHIIIAVYCLRESIHIVHFKGINIYTSNSKRYKLLSDEEGYIRLPENYKNRQKYEQYPLDTILEIHLIIDEIDYLYFHYIYSSDEFVVEISSE